MEFLLLQLQWKMAVIENNLKSCIWNWILKKKYYLISFPSVSVFLLKKLRTAMMHLYTRYLLLLVNFFNTFSRAENVWSVRMRESGLATHPTKYICICIYCMYTYRSTFFGKFQHFLKILRPLFFGGSDPLKLIVFRKNYCF